ncbi:MAG: hypothetical protein QOF89_6198 [Acidobacteriota bacterium]|jgi:hypothetical protein|nr:hypothetical protein [Acidobacteriota bacterium]
MIDEHFSRYTVEQFFRSALSQAEMMPFVRHLLRQCPACCGLVREVVQSRSFRLVLLRGGSDSEPMQDRLRPDIVARPRLFAVPTRMIRRA